jgi:hypothetical protein
MASFMPPLLYSQGKSPQYPLDRKQWALKLVWMKWRKEKYSP